MSNETYSRAPFISYDGKDSEGHRAEVKVVIGFGEVFDIEESDKGKAAKIIFKVSNSKYKSSGWAPLDSTVYTKAVEAMEAKEPIHFRIETRRRDNIDRHLTMAEVSPKGDAIAAKDNIVKSLAAVRLEADEEWTISSHAKTRLDEDPTSSGSPSAYDSPLEELRPKPMSYNPNPPVQYGIEGTPFQTFNRNGSLNLGSVAVSVPLNLFTYVTEYEKANADLNLTEKQRLILSKLMLSASNEIQVTMYSEEEESLEKPDLSLGSHTRARALVFECIRTYYPITNELLEDNENLKEWRGELVKKSLILWKWSVSEVNKIIS